MADFEQRLACVIDADGSVVRGYLVDRCEGQSERVSHFAGRSRYRARRRPTLPAWLAVWPRGGGARLIYVGDGRSR